MRKILHILTALAIAAQGASAQSGGETAYAFLGLSPWANGAAIGGIAPAAQLPGPGAALANPALADTLCHQSAAASMASYAAGIRYASAFYSHQAGGMEITGGAMMLDYGQFDLTDEAANILGTFSCRDNMAFLSASRPIAGNLRLGASIKVILSRMEQYRSQGLAFDIGIAYRLPEQKICMGLAVLNSGLQLSTYSGTREGLPLDIQIGISKTLLHAPLRLSLAMHSINRPRLAKSFGESLANHFVVSAELFPEGAVSLKGGFRFQRHNELRPSGASPFPGFSMGIDVRLRRLSIQYSRECLSPAASANMITAEVFIGRLLNFKPLL